MSWPGVLAHTIAEGRGEGWDILAQWSFDPTVLVAVLLPGVLYAAGLKRWTARPRPLRPWQPYFFYAGLAFSFLALVSPIDALADDLFMMHMVQHMIIQLIAPPLILLGAPTTPILRGLPRWVRQDVVRPLVRNSWVRSAYNLVTFPVFAWGLFVATTWTWHLAGGAYDAALRNEGLHILEHFTFFATALLFWWTLVDPRPLRARLTYPLRVLFLVATMAQNVALGVIITFKGGVLYSFYETGPRMWGLAPLDDQQAGGALMWVGGVMMLMVAVVVTVLVWYEKSEQRAQREEAEMDRMVQLASDAGGRPALEG